MQRLELELRSSSYHFTSISITPSAHPQERERERGGPIYLIAREDEQIAQSILIIYTNSP